MSKHQPATPLPWPTDGTYRPVITENTKYAIHAANAYPGLVELMREVDDLLPRISDDDPMAPALRDWLRKVRATMRDLGELE